MIYKHVLISGDETSPDITNGGPDTRPLSLLLVSKQTYLEAFHIFYEHNLLSFTNVDSLWRFLTIIGPARCVHLARIKFVSQGPIFECEGAFRLLQKCPKLRRLDIVLNTIDDYAIPGRRRLDIVLNTIDDNAIPGDRGCGMETLRWVGGLDVMIFLTEKLEAESRDSGYRAFHIHMVLWMLRLEIAKMNQEHRV